MLSATPHPHPTPRAPPLSQLSLLFFFLVSLSSNSHLRRLVPLQVSHRKCNSQLQRRPHLTYTKGSSYGHAPRLQESIRHGLKKTNDLKTKPKTVSFYYVDHFFDATALFFCLFELFACLF